MNSPSPPPECILVVDDQEQNLRVVGTVLTMMGYEIVLATSAEQAFKRLAARTPDLILLDLLMPGVDGLEACRRLKSDGRYADVPVIFLSAADDKNLVVQALESGGVDYLTKPFNKAELLSRVRTHLALKKARDDLRHLAEDKDELLGILAHDLKNHLAGMKLSAGLLADRADELPPRCLRLAENIAHSTDRMLVFVKEFLANQSAERLALRPVRADLGAIVRAATERHRAAAGVKRIDLSADIPAEPVAIFVDTEAVSQVFDNLLTNAIKFSPAGKSVRVAIGAPAGGFARCTVQDEGPGFTAEDQQRMFSRYGRLSARPTGGEPSTGLGLSIVKRLVESMQGKISLESEPGEGAVFALLLPLDVGTDGGGAGSRTEAAETAR
jgi:two-component system sensor histidine kinase/response regulator